MAPAVISHSRRLVLHACPGPSAARSGALQTRDRFGPWRSRINDAPLRWRSRCVASGTHDTDGHSSFLSHDLQQHTLPRRGRFCVNALSPQHALAGSIPVFSCFSADSDLPSPGLTISNNTHSIVPAAHFCARGLQRCFTHPESRGGRSAEKRSGAALSTRWTRHNAACQAPSEAPCVP
jgi:hypothetical protein